MWLCGALAGLDRALGPLSRSEARTGAFEGLGGYQTGRQDSVMKCDPSHRLKREPVLLVLRYGGTADQAAGLADKGYCMYPRPLRT